MPRWVAYEERFVVAEEGGEVMAAVRYRTEPKRLLPGLLVADPWRGGGTLAAVLYSGARAAQPLPRDGGRLVCRRAQAR